MASIINANTSGGLISTGDTSGQLQLQTGGTTALTVTSAQRVGVGTTSPTTILQVSATTPVVTVTGTSTTASSQDFTTNSAAQRATIGVEQSAGGGLFVGSSAYAAVFGSAGASSTQFASNNTVQVTLDTSGNLGVGTTSPSTYGKLVSYNVGGVAYPIALIGNDQSNTRLRIKNTNGGDFTLVGGTPGISNAGLAFYDETNSATRMLIDSSGNLFVGTTGALAQTGRLTFVGTGNVLIAQAGNGQTAFQSTNTSGTAAYYAAIWNNNGNSFSTCGTIQVSGTTTSYNTSSDYRLKEDVQPMTGALAKVALLKPVTYKWKADGSDGEGFIAHELAEVCPHAVSGEKDAVKEDNSIMPQGIDTSFLVATLTAAIQELSTQLTELKAEVATLRGA